MKMQHIMCSSKPPVSSGSNALQITPLKTWIKSQRDRKEQERGENRKQEEVNKVCVSFLQENVNVPTMTPKSLGERKIPRDQEKSAQRQEEEKQWGDYEGWRGVLWMVGLTK